MHDYFLWNKSGPLEQASKLGPHLDLGQESRMEVWGDPAEHTGSVLLVPQGWAKHINDYWKHINRFLKQIQYIHFKRSWRERFPVLQGLWRTQKSSHKKSVSFKPLPDTEDTTTSSGQSQSGENLSCHSPLLSHRDSQMVGEGHCRQENNNDKTTRPCFPLQLAHLT